MALFSLKLDCRFISDDGNFEEYDPTDHSGRAWWKENGQPVFMGNPDGPGHPDGKRLEVKIGDQVRFAVREKSGASIRDIFVTFGRGRGAGNPAKVGAPFQHAGNRARCILFSGDSGVQQDGEWSFIGPFPIQLNTHGSREQKWRFGFTLVARVTDGTVTKDFGYDPEMDVDIP